MEPKSALWDENREELQSLRLPKSLPNLNEKREPVDTKKRELLNNQHETPNFSNDSQKEQNRNEDIIARSTLKVDAPEWFPSTHVCKNSIVSRKNIHDIDKILEKCEVKEDCYLYGSNEDSHDIIRLKQIISTLTKDPGQFDNLLHLFMETLRPYFEDIMSLSVIAQVLVEQAINNSNFRYTGAKLCWYVEQNCPEFRAELHLKCKKQLEDNSNKQNVLLFIAELYTQLPHLNIYGALLIDCYKQLLNKGGNENIKCICQALKLTGHSLEFSNKIELDEVFVQLRLTKESVNGSVNALIDCVENLRSSNWGYSVDVSTEEDHLETIYYGDFENTTFYRTDGDTFTSEETEFLTAHLDSNLQYLSDNSDPDDLCDPEPEMDEEIQAAFKEFVKLNKH